MVWWLAIPFTLLLLLAAVAIGSLTGFNPTPFLVIGTAIWGAYDSSRIQLRRYESLLATSPVLLFFALVLLWVVVFPWYLIVRHHIRAGEVELS